MLGNIPDSSATFDKLWALQSEALGAKWWGILSHVTLVVLAGLGGHFREPLSVVLPIIVLLISETYHICFSFNVCMGLEPIQTWQNDRFTAPLCLILLAYYIITLHDTDVTPLAVANIDPEARQRLANVDSYDVELLDNDDTGHLNVPLYESQWLRAWLLLVGIAAGLVTFNWPPGDLYPTLVVLVFCIVGWVLYAVMRNERNISPDDDAFMINPTRPNWPWIVGGVLFAALGIGMYLMPETTTTLEHSFWHFFIGIALCFFLAAKKTRPTEPLYRFEVRWYTPVAGG